MRTHHWTSLSLLSVLAIAYSAPSARAGELKAHRTPYYILHTDLDEDGVREASLRITKMAEEYARRTRGFAGIINQPMPFYLYKDRVAYRDATGAPDKTVGFFSVERNRLVAVAGDLGPQTWNTVQHEGFHQFAHAVIQGELPIWVNEGLADYYGEGIFTGDGFVTGVIPPHRLQRIRKTMAAGGFKPFDKFMEMSSQEWAAELEHENYDQAWSMVQFLAHAQNGKFQQPFSNFIAAIGRGVDWHIAWAQTIRDTQGFEKAWKTWWMQLDEHPTLDLYAKATTETLTSYLGRARSQGQTYFDIDQFLAAAKAGELKSHPDDWLPPALLKSAVERVGLETDEGCTFTISTRGTLLPKIVCTLPDGRRLTAQFKLNAPRVGEVTSEISAK